MNRLLLYLASVLFTIGIMAGCSSDTDTNSTEDTSTATEEQAEDQGNTEENEDTVTITISKDDGEEVLDEKEVAIETDAVLMDVLKENFDVEDEDGFITSIDGVSPKKDEEKAWMFFVNDEIASVGAEDYELEPSDEVTFDLQAWE